MVLTMTRTIDQRVLDLLELVLEVFRAVDGERAEAEVEGDATLLRLRVLVESCGARHGAQTLSQRCFAAEMRASILDKFSRRSQGR